MKLKDIGTYGQFLYKRPSFADCTPNVFIKIGQSTSGKILAYEVGYVTKEEKKEIQCLAHTDEAFFDENTEVEPIQLFYKLRSE